MRTTRYQKDFIHPEIKPGEVFFSNCDSVSFALIPWWSKRRGQRAYTGLGHALKIKDWFPVFVQVEELRRARLSIPEARQEFRARIESPHYVASMC